jgi:hypothetical protein
VPIASPDVLDEDWIPAVAARGWLIITRDSKIIENRSEISARQLGYRIAGIPRPLVILHALVVRSRLISGKAYSGWSRWMTEGRANGTVGGRARGHDWRHIR